MATTRMKEGSKWDRAVIAAKLSAIAYMNEKPAITAAKKLGFAWVKLISKDGAEVLIAKDRNDLWMEIVKELEHNDQLKVRKDVYYTGHSLGAAMATISATRYQPHELFTFGSPRVGGKRFIKNIKCNHYRFMNNNDIVCRIPPAWLGFRHHGQMIYFNRNGDKQLKPTWGDMFYGIFNSWKRFKFFDGVVDHGMPNYVKAIKRLSTKEK